MQQSGYVPYMEELPGGMDYWKFTAQKEYGIDVESSSQSEKNIFSSWPTSYNEDTIRFDTERISRETILVRSQNVSLAQIQSLKYIKTSPLVQIMTSKTDRRTILIDDGSLTIYQDGDKLYQISFKVSYTDTIASQSL